MGTMVTYYVLMGFQVGKGGMLIADEPQEIHGGKDRCLSAAKRLKASRAGVVAFSRTGDPSLGDWEDAQLLFQDGILPEDIFEVAC